MSLLRRAVVTTGLVGVGGLAYASGYELHAFRLRQVDVPVLPPEARPVKVLHLSDIHLMPNQRRKLRWLESLATLEPDLVVNTGDNIAAAASIEPLLRAFEPLDGLPGAFVFGSNDYWAPVLKNPARYLFRSDPKPVTAPPLPWRELRSRLVGLGWVDLTNTKGELTVGETRIAVAGVDDPHLGYDRPDAVDGPADRDADLRLAISHAPYLRILDAFTRTGYDVVLAGHTHGGQLRLPVKGAIVTNCDLDRARSRGLHRHTVGGRTAWLHVSAGLGTSPYAPFRFCCNPEASLLRLMPRGT